MIRKKILKKMNSQEYIEVCFRLEPFTQENAEILIAELGGELPYESFVTEDAPGAGEPALVKGYIQKEAYSASQLRVVLSGLTFDVSFTATLVIGENWNRSWEERFEPIVVDGVVTVKAPFNKNVRRTRYNIWIEPNMAFGTGYHHTTYMMMSEMLRIADRIRGGVVVDMGCGTAVLAILAAKMGARKVSAIDIDLVAAKSAWGNARWNRVGTRIETCCGDASLLQMGKYDVLLANINRNILLQDMPTYARSLRRGGVLLLSGFFDGDVPMLLDAATAAGLHPVDSRTLDGWACLRLEK